MNLNLNFRKSQQDLFIGQIKTKGGKQYRLEEGTPRQPRWHVNFDRFKKQDKPVEVPERFLSTVLKDGLTSEPENEYTILKRMGLETNSTNRAKLRVAISKLQDSGKAEIYFGGEKKHARLKKVGGEYKWVEGDEAMQEGSSGRYLITPEGAKSIKKSFWSRMFGWLSKSKQLGLDFGAQSFGKKQPSLFGEKEEHQVGETKTEGGKTYELKEGTPGKARWHKQWVEEKKDRPIKPETPQISWDKMMKREREGVKKDEVDPVDKPMSDEEFDKQWVERGREGVKREVTANIAKAEKEISRLEKLKANDPNNPAVGKIDDGIKKQREYIEKQNQRLKMEIKKPSEFMDTESIKWHKQKLQEAKQPEPKQDKPEKPKRDGEPVKSSFQLMAERSVAAEDKFVENVMEQFNFNKDEAEKILDVYMKNKLVKIDSVTGDFKIKHGAFWEKEPMERALEGDKPKQDKPEKKEPWEMTKGEWEEAREGVKPDTAQKNFTRRSEAEATARHKELERLLYGARDEIKTKLKDAQAGKIKMSSEDAEELQEILNTRIKHKDVIDKALKEGKPVPEEVLKDYPDLQKKEGKPEQPKEKAKESRPMGEGDEFTYQGKEYTITRIAPGRVDAKLSAPHKGKLKPEQRGGKDVDAFGLQIPIKDFKEKFGDVQEVSVEEYKESKKQPETKFPEKIKPEGLTPTQTGRLNKELDKKYDFSKYGVTTFRELIDKGIFTGKKTQGAPFNRKHYNRLSADEQKEYEKRLEAKKEYLVSVGDSSFDIPKIIYDALDVPDNTKQTEPESGPEPKKDKHEFDLHSMAPGVTDKAKQREPEQPKEKKELWQMTKEEYKQSRAEVTGTAPRNWKKGYGEVLKRALWAGKDIDRNKLKSAGVDIDVIEMDELANEPMDKHLMNSIPPKGIKEPKEVVRLRASDGEIYALASRPYSVDPAGRRFWKIKVFNKPEVKGDEAKELQKALPDEEEHFSRDGESTGRWVDLVTKDAKKFYGEFQPGKGDDK